MQNQWNEFVALNVQSHDYSEPLSSIFGPRQPEANGHAPDEDEDDPIVHQLRFVDYRYIRLFYHDQDDKMMVNSSWWDPEWRRVKHLQAGIHGDVKASRQTVFGENVIQIDEKSTFQILVDEVL